MNEELTKDEIIEGLKYANKELGWLLDERDKRDNRLAFQWFILGVVVTSIIYAIFFI